MRHSGFEYFQHRVESKTSVRSYAKLTDVARYVGETGCQQFHTPLPRARIARTQFRIPEIGRVGFNAQQRVVGTLPAITRIVADLGALLTPENCHHGAVEIQDEPGSAVGKVDESLQQSIIHTVQLTQK